MFSKTLKYGLEFTQRWLRECLCPALKWLLMFQSFFKFDYNTEVNEECAGDTNTNIT